MAEKNPRVIFLTGDLGFQVFDDFKSRFGPRYVNVGVAEAQLVYAAAGLALEGWRPVIYSIASFATGRPFEQIRLCINYPNLPVVIVGAGGGYTYSSSGVTHHAGDDLGLMSLLPHVTVVAPGDPNEVKELLPQLLALKGPSYIRIGRFGEPSYEAEAPVTLGRARLIRKGKKLAIVATGDAISFALQAADLLKSEGVSPWVYQMHTVKPLDTEALEKLAVEVDTILVVEEHLPTGGLFDAVSQWRACRKEGPRVVRLGPNDSLVLGSPEREELRRRIHCDRNSIAETCRHLWSQ